MKNFTINCIIKNELQKLTVKFRQSSIAYFYIYKDNFWVGTVSKCGDQQYHLISYSKFSISQKDINAIGEQLDVHERLILSPKNPFRTFNAA
ncbi:hypothetical protein IDJ77_04490 [Mucilaginibacter sp. ZT4R22]|uniref:Uncharacterized protein n=1 Tax=Mucilaginibacter pankratovii TaxID=2772110 RepID=A0ABR7WL69_9SPHI|nr:hypothetical protein [Mucilaginibacter pankratovii]MBD1363061.1 hypothetical protein [Mucilaginibacter pankratovii]